MKSWMRGRALLTTSAFIALGCFGLGTPAFAADVAYQFDIPAEPLGQALSDYSQVSSQQIIFSDEAVAGRKTSGLHGRYTSAQALDALLVGTDLNAKANAAGVLMVQSKNVQAASNEEAAPLTIGKAENLETIVVTGTHIDGIQPASPVLSITRADIDRSGYTQVGDLMRSLPQNFGGGRNPNQQRNTVANNSVDGASSINLRGIGPDATLVLINGQRMADDDTSQAPNVSAIPLLAIDRIDVVTDGASALYGSDAVAGVVNFITRSKYDGFEVTATAGGATQGGGFEQDYNALGGTSWSGGHALAAVEYLDQGGILATQRDFTATVPPINTLAFPHDQVSVYANASQDISDWAEFQINGLYTRLMSIEQAVYGTTPDIVTARDYTYAIYPSVDFKLGGDWKATLDSSISGSSDHYPQLYGTSFSNSASTNRTNSVEASANGTLLTLPTGDIKVAVGGGYRDERLHVLASGNTQLGSRQILYAFGELSAPLVVQSNTRIGLEELDVDVAARIENYNSFGTTTNPKIGIHYVPFEELSLRGTWGTSFKAPSLYQLIGQRSVILYPASTLGSSAAGTALEEINGNPDLEPERARSWTIGADWVSADYGLDVSLTYFNTHYTNRVVNPINVLGQALSNPIYASFVTSNPSAAAQAAAIASTPYFYNETTSPYNPANTIALVDNLYTNAASQEIDGIDLNVKKTVTLNRSNLDMFANASWLNVQQQLTPKAPAAGLSGVIFGPPSARLRSGMTWSDDSWAVTGIINYNSGTTDTTQTPNVPIAEYETIDLTVSYVVPIEDGPLSGVGISLAATNLFDQDPPYAKGAAVSAPGIFYDSANSSPIGRFVSVSLRKQF